jgi:hypothetical protein
MKHSNWSRRLLCGFSFVLPLVGATAVADAFPFGFSWMQPADSNTPAGNDNTPGRAGGGGIWATGSHFDKGIDCQSCHIKAAADKDKVIGVNIVATPNWDDPDDPTKKLYVPGQSYTLTLTLTNEQKLPGGGIPHTLNGFAATFEVEDTQQRAGVLKSDIAGVDSSSCPATFPNPAPTNGTSYVYGNCQAIVYIPKDEATTWTFGWTAPSSNVGPVRLYYSVVDGDAHGKSALDDIVNTNSIVIDPQ